VSHKVPTYLKLLRGNPGKRALKPELEPTPELPPSPPDPPASLSAYAKEEWLRIRDEMFYLRLLTPLDLQIFAVYCETYARWRTAVEALKKQAAVDPEFHALVFRDEEGELRANPLCRIISNAGRDLLKVAGELGCTPLARSRIGEAGGLPPPPRGQSKFDGLLGPIDHGRY
jgi:P27 family predicted phage terminase small subunit